MAYYPRLLINLSSIRHNARTIYELLSSKGISVIAVTKGTTSHPVIVDAISSQGIKYIGDSRILNIKRLKPLYPHLHYVLLRLPMLSEVDDVVEFSDVSLNSEISVIKALGERALAKGKIHKIILMVDVGDRREGILPHDLMDMVDKVKDIKGIEISGIGANFACFGGVLPDEKNLSLLARLAKEVEDRIGSKLTFVSGGSTSSIYLVLHGKMPHGINNLRIGTGILLGYDDVRDVDIEGTRKDTFFLEAEIIELKEKPSLPEGKIAKDAFGNIPHFEDKGIMKRAILGIGKQDVIFTSCFPIDRDIEIIGGSSDHMILDITKAQKRYRVGDVIRFEVEYPAMLYLFNSSYVDKIFVEEVDK